MPGVSKFFRSLLPLAILLFSGQVFAASYSLPADTGSGAFSGCTLSGSVITCTGDVTLTNNDSIVLTGDVTLNISGNFDTRNGVNIDNNGFVFSINVVGTVNIGTNATITADITAGGDITITNNVDFTGNISSGGNIDIGNNGTFSGDITAAGTLDIGRSTGVIGICTPFHPQCSGGGGPSLDHFSITPTTTSASTCLPNAITIIAEDSSNNPVTGYASQINITTSTNHGNWSINNADNTLLPVVDNNDDGAVRYTFVTSDAGEIVLDLSNTHAETLTITVSDAGLGISSSSASISFNRNVFIITEDPIQIAGRPQAMTIAMWTDDTAGSGSCAIDTRYNSSAQNLQGSIDRFGVLTAANAPSIGGTGITDSPMSAGITLDFSVTPGQASFNLDTSDVGQYELTLEDVTLVHSDLIISGTSSLLTVRPFGLAVTNIIAGATVNPGSFIPTDPIFTTAGSNFSATVASVLWDASDDLDNNGVLDTGVYSDNVIAPGYAWDTMLAVSPVGFEPSTGVAGSLNNGTILQADFSAGSSTPNNLQYTEVGSFTLQSSATDYLGELTADLVGDDIIVGRFIPAAFLISATVDGMLANSCTLGATPFTYIGETFFYDVIHPSFEVSAVNALAIPTVTQNYTGALWAKLDDNSVSFTQPTSDITQVGSDTATLMALTYTQDAALFTITEISGGIFNFEFADDQFVYDRDANSEISPFNSDIDLIITDVTDLDGVTNTGSFTLNPSAIELRFGRIKMSNVHGSELIDLAMPMFTEYLDASGSYLVNSDDECTLVTTANLVITDNLSVFGSSAVTVTNNPIASGDLGITLTAPGAGIDGNIIVSPGLTGVADWLQYDWDGLGLFDDDPSAIATFGIFTGNDVNIYKRQTYQ
jgi:MSHA biogenesis protein MshQ